MYSYKDRLRAVELYIRLGKRLNATIRQLQLEHDLLKNGQRTQKKDLGVYLQILRNREKTQLIDALRKFIACQNYSLSCELPEAPIFTIARAFVWQKSMRPSGTAFQTKNLRQASLSRPFLIG